MAPAGLRPTLDCAHPLFGLGYARPMSAHQFVHLEAGTAHAGTGTIADEVPVALVYNGRPHVVMMCTPADIEDFARGFTCTEEIVAGAAEITSIRALRYSQGIEVEIAIPAAAARALEERGRALVGRTGCGLCGVTTIDDAIRAGRTVASGGRVAPDALFRAVAELPTFQPVNVATSAVHAAGWAQADGRIIVAREDVGRHNALDKLIGALAARGLDPAAGFAVVTSRASYELVQKCAVAGITLLGAISRPTALAIRLAEATGITLAARVRGRSADVYTHPDRLCAT